MRIRELKQLTPGTRIEFSNSFKNFWKDHAWEQCTVRGVLDTEEHAMDYMARKAVSIGLPYEARIVKFLDDVTLDPGNPVPGAKIEFLVGDHKDTTIVTHKELRKYV